MPYACISLNLLLLCCCQLTNVRKLTKAASAGEEGGADKLQERRGELPQLSQSYFIASNLLSLVLNIKYIFLYYIMQILPERERDRVHLYLVYF